MNGFRDPVDIVPEIVNGSTPKEKLQNIFNRSTIFHGQIITVRKYMEDLLDSSDNKTDDLIKALNGTINHLRRLYTLVEKLLKNLGMNNTTTVSTEKSQVKDIDDYEKKVYGLLVLQRLQSFLVSASNELAGFNNSSLCHK
ncbi:hypothetical protein DPEC_G00257200 [Dallia pectoralis]|uniref:Uncharacterized protein n=1 Tax=Dallia pectoralis TaxID=75939 RepID=A0ACC2FQU1_DALPE|nr:hypothetical protein DPEC_G00257200 [Dallia pectoralis]